jgi:hypothetical protein
LHVGVPVERFGARLGGQRVQLFVRQVLPQDRRYFLPYVGDQERGFERLGVGALLRGNQDEGRASIWMRKRRRMRDGGRA